MADPSLIVCPVDFSEPSRTALRFAGVLADHFGARLLVLSVDDPLLASVAASRGELAGATERELRQFVEATLAAASPVSSSLEVRVAVGKPSAEILRAARESRADLIVISSQGRSGTAKRFFGSTTEGVLRSAATPVLVTPKTAEHVESLSHLARAIGCVLAPVDLSPASARQVAIAAGIGSGLGLPVVVPYVLEPLFVPPSLMWAMPEVDSDRRPQAEARLRELARTAVPDGSVETIVLDGSAPDAIANLAAERHAGLIVMGLHAAGLLGPRMGSVTYRVLSITEALVLAIPPEPGSAPGDGR